MEGAHRVGAAVARQAAIAEWPDPRRAGGVRSSLLGLARAAHEPTEEKLGTSHNFQRISTAAVLHVCRLARESLLFRKRFK